MKKSVFINTYLTATLALAMTFAVACTRPGQKTPAPTGVTPLSLSTMEGTTDGAGGNGINGKTYESYIVNPQVLAAYEVLRPKIEAMSKTWMDAENKADNIDDAEPLFNLLWKIKKWYVAPVSLKTLNKQTIGVEFTNENTEQLALQTESEVWIDSRLFEKMPREDQARLLMHEYVMSLYLLKFTSVFDLCNLGKTASENPDRYRCGPRDVVEKLLPAQAQRDLNKEDYSHIRSVTDTLLEKGEKLSQKEIANLFIIHGFDKRVFRVYNSNNKDTKVSKKNLVSALKHAVYTQKLNGPCQGLQSHSTQSCIVEMKDSQLNNGEYDIELVLKATSTQHILRTLKLELPFEDFPVFDFNFEFGSYVFLHEKAPKDEGAHFGSLVLLFEEDEDNNPSNIAGVVFVKNIVTSSEEPENSGPKCARVEAAPLKTNRFDDDAIWAGKVPQQEDKGYLEAITSSTSFFQTCPISIQP